MKSNKKATNECEIASFLASVSTTPPEDWSRFRAYRLALPEGWSVAAVVYLLPHGSPSTEGRRDSLDLVKAEGGKLRPFALAHTPEITPEQAVLRYPGDLDLAAVYHDDEDQGRKERQPDAILRLLPLERTTEDHQTDRGVEQPGVVYLPLLTMLPPTQADDEAVPLSVPQPYAPPPDGSGR